MSQLTCPSCGGTYLIKNGHKFIGGQSKQKYICKDCDYETVNPAPYRPAKNNVLIISDLHIPYEHPKALRFCSDLKREYNCNEVVFIGDIFDFAGFSTHVKNPDAYSSGGEISEANSKVLEWASEFSNAKICFGNHELRLNKRMMESGIPQKFVPTLNKVFNLPETWEWEFHHTIDGVRYMHGSISGLYAHARLALSYMQSVVHGHTHSTGAVQYMSTDDKLVWGMNCGCLIDTKSYAFQYARDFVRRPVIGTGVVLDGGRLPIFIPVGL